jgi:hypothetical protein
MTISLWMMTDDNIMDDDDTEKRWMMMMMMAMDTMTDDDDRILAENWLLPLRLTLLHHGCWYHNTTFSGMPRGQSRIFK